MSTSQTENIYSDLEILLSDVIGAPVRFPEVGKRIKEIRGGKSQEQFAQEIGVEQQRYLSSYEKGQFLAKNALVLRKAAAQDPHKRGLRWLLGGDKALQITTRVSETPAPYGNEGSAEFERVAALDCEVAAGPGHDTKITTSDKHAPQVRWVAMPKQALNAPAEFYRWLRVHGDSMEPAYPDKSWVLVNLLRHDPRKHKLIDRPVVVWLERDKGCTLKILQERKELQDHWILHALNPEGESRYVAKTEPHVQFAAVEAAWRKVA